MARLPVDVEIDLNGRALPPAVETTLLRVLQEATTNVLRHAEATRVGVILEVRDDEVRLIVEDNGKGFPANDGVRRSSRHGDSGCSACANASRWCMAIWKSKPHRNMALPCSSGFR